MYTIKFNIVNCLQLIFPTQEPFSATFTFANKYHIGNITILDLTNSIFNIMIIKILVVERKGNRMKKGQTFGKDEK